MSRLALLFVVAFLASPSLAAYPQVDGNFTISVTNQPSSNQYCVADSIAYTLDLTNVPKANPNNSSDATYLSIMVMGPPQDPSVDPNGISKTPRGLVVGALGKTLVSTFSGSDAYVVEEKLKGFTGLFLRAIVFYDSQSALFESFQTAASSKTPFSIAKSCNSTSTSPSLSSTSSSSTSASSSTLPTSSTSDSTSASSSQTSSSSASSSSSQNSTSSILYSGAVAGASVSRFAAFAAVPLLILLA
ncbi:hypothetical protein DFJ73DRAFT_865195 [Zopfochytrium polystomum]|nr:hypothetical protein DFJ73DRAFT_865195 [Zopfochytrium polystomum]